MSFSSDSLPLEVATLDDAYAACARLARSHYENFPVASWWLPGHLRRAVAVVYAFARCADDFADEPGLEEPARLARLADWRTRLGSGATGHERHPVFWALADVFRQHPLSPEPFEKLITAFEIDVKNKRHATFDDLMFYCAHSANPVGEVLLRLFNGWTEIRGHGSDAVCTALQLANFWQDVTVDTQKNRLYIPQEDLARFHVSEKDVFEGAVSDPMRKLIAFQVERTWTLFDEGRSLLSDAPAGLKKELRLVWLGGTEILRKIEAQGCDVWSGRPTVTKMDWFRLFGKMCLGVPGPVRGRR
jgi:squalene synthase HpnC